MEQRIELDEGDGPATHAARGKESAVISEALEGTFRTFPRITPGGDLDPRVLSKDLLLTEASRISAGARGYPRLCILDSKGC